MVAQSTNLNSVAARLRTDKDDYAGMATVIGPQLAITAGPATNEIFREYTLELDGPSGPFTVPAKVLSSDDRFDFALLGLQSPVDNWLAPSSDIPEDANYWKSFEWQCFYKGPDAPEGKFLHGTIGGDYPTDARNYLLLNSATAFGSVRGCNGAPVVCENRLIGIIAKSTTEADAFFAVPITEMVRSSLWSAIREASEQPTPTLRDFDEVTFFNHLSKPALIALERADAIRFALGSNERIHTEHLLAGLFKDPKGTPREAFAKVGIDELKLPSIIKATANKDIPLDREYEIHALTHLPPMSKHVQQAFVAANDAAKNDEWITMGHLLVGILSVADCALTKGLRSFGLNQDDIPLRDRTDEITKPSAKRRYANAGISSDGPDGPDLLDIETEVEALCTVLAAKDIEPPISLGLFGDWGSGKSFFMRKMEKRFDELKALAKEKDSDYCANIVQLWFNAWHYMDTDLWASLATEIFDGLAEYLGKEQALLQGKKEPDYERAQLIAQNANANDELAKARAAKRSLDEQIQAKHKQLASIRSGEMDVPADSRAALRETYQFAVQHPEVSEAVKVAKKQLKDEIDSAAKKLNIDADQETVQKQILELQGIWGYVRAIGLAARDKRNRKLWWLSFLLAVLILVGIGLIPLLWNLDTVASTVSRIAAVVLAIAGFVGPFLPRVRSALQIIDGAIKANFNALEKARSAEEAKLQQEQEQLEKDAKTAQVTLDAAVKNAESLKQQLQSLQPDQQILDFIKRRQQSTDYTKYLGVIAKARNDFEELSSLLAKERERRATIQSTKEKEPSKETEKKENEAAAQLLLPRIDRIILYIDDLDRCPEKKVVDVLQAVHLLLAFPLFIVVVGVDSRWLLHSLREHAEVFRNEGKGLSQEEQRHWQSTPLNYLEKIFQVPFTLWPMEKSGFGRMIESLTKSKAPTDKDNKQAQEAKNQTTGKSESKEVGKPTGDGIQSAPAAQTSQPAGEVDKSDNKATTSDYAQATKPKSDLEEKHAERPIKVIDPHPAHLQLTRWEVEFMKELHCLIPSPRATKRFVNVYRLIRASVDIEDELQLKEFVGDSYQGQYKAVLLLLAIVTGYPDQATEILRELISRKHDGNWLDFVESFRKRAPEPEVALTVEEVAAHRSKKQGAAPVTSHTKGDSKPEVMGNGSSPHNGESHREMTAAEAERWEDLIEKLTKLRPLIRSESCAHFTKWAPKVARYSFQSGRVLLMQNAAEEP